MKHDPKKGKILDFFPFSVNTDLNMARRKKWKIFKVKVINLCVNLIDITLNSDFKFRLKPHNYIKTSKKWPSSYIDHLDLAF